MAKEESTAKPKNFWETAQFDKNERPVLDPDKIPDKPPGSIPLGMSEWPSEEKIREMKLSAAKHIKTSSPESCEYAARAYYTCFLNGMEQHNPNLLRDCLDTKLELMFCMEDWHLSERDKAAEKLGKEKLEILQKRLEAARGNMSEEAAKRKADFVEYRQKVRDEFEKRKARNEQAKSREIPVTAEKTGPKKAWWKFGW